MNRTLFFAIVLVAFAWCLGNGVRNVLFAVNGYGTATVAPKMHATATVFDDDTSKIYVQRYDGLTTARLVLLCETESNPLFEVTMDFRQTDNDTTNTLSGISGLKGRWVR